MAIRISTPIVRQLQAEGFLPFECAGVELHIPPMGPMVLRYEVFMTDARLKQLGGAFLALADEIEKLKEEEKSA